MSTVTYKCGCQFTYCMHGKRELLDFDVCQRHLPHPKVQGCNRDGLHAIILEILNEEEIDTCPL